MLVTGKRAHGRPPLGSLPSDVRGLLRIRPAALQPDTRSEIFVPQRVSRPRAATSLAGDPPQRRLIVLTGDIGTGKTTLCRTLLEQFDETTFTALILNPFVSVEELLREVLLSFGV